MGTATCLFVGIAGHCILGGIGLGRSSGIDDISVPNTLTGGRKTLQANNMWGNTATLASVTAV
ncbi:hypothetical protein OAG34_01740 [bacterium]|nr:hypothetical protein [bacterium]